MLRKIIASLAITICCLADPLPAKAEMSTCWIPQTEAERVGDVAIQSQPCDINIREEGGTKFVYIYTPTDGSSMKLVFYYNTDDQPMYVDIYHLSGKKAGSMFFMIDEQGDIKVYNSSHTFYFSLPGVQPQREVMPAQDIFSGRGLTT